MYEIFRWVGHCRCSKGSMIENTKHATYQNQYPLTFNRVALAGSIFLPSAEIRNKCCREWITFYPTDLQWYQAVISVSHGVTHIPMLNIPSRQLYPGVQLNAKTAYTSAMISSSDTSFPWCNPYPHVKYPIKTVVSQCAIECKNGIHNRGRVHLYVVTMTNYHRPANSIVIVMWIHV